MSLTRRRFLGTASLSLLAGAALPGVFAQRSPGRKDDTFSLENQAAIENASEETFKPLIGESFAVMKGRQQLESLTLTDVVKPEPVAASAKRPLPDRAPRYPAQQVASFSLRFQGSGSQQLPQGTYVLKSASLGSLSLFISPSDPKTNPHGYAAVFSLLP